MKILCVIAAIVASTSALTLNCEFRDVNWLAVGPNYQCYSEAFNVDSTQTVTAVSGNHVENKTAEDIYSLHIDNCTNLSYIPKGLLTVFPNLRGIYLEGCAVASLSGTELDEYPRLTVFAVEFSPLDYVPGNLFAQTPDMVLISFAENNITEVGRNLLDGLNDVSQVYFEHNICIDHNAETPEEIPGLVAVLEADCSSETTDTTTDTPTNTPTTTTTDATTTVSSSANERLKSAVLLCLLCSGFACIRKYFLIN